MATAGLAAQAVVGLELAAQLGHLDAELVAPGVDFHYVVHQGVGMVASALGISVGQALLRLKAYAFANDRLLADVAEDVVARKLRLGTGTDEGPSGA